ncbi:MAG: electron transfer flavoprotein subunit alpha/FixB family protein [Candidatus Carbobacillus altaicus]|nr:electron transfer flavoprotein subunit alpha/FixB family protein [Candidatus Carbobacillus altaicus]
MAEEQQKEIVDETVDVKDLDAWRGIWIYGEVHDGELEGVALELLHAARPLADALETELGAVLLGSGVKRHAETLIAHGADNVYVVDHPELANYRTEVYHEALYQLIVRYKPEIMLFGSTANGKDLASAIATDLETGLTADTTMLGVNKEERLLEASRPAFGGNIMATILCKKHRPQMATVRPRVMRAGEPDVTRQGKINEESVTFSSQNLLKTIIETVKESSGDSGLETADIVVAFGKGVGDQRGLEMVQALAGVLGAAVGASRDVVEMGLIGREHQVGQTGVTVMPKIYIAIGISGAVQHLVGMQNSGTIIAINTDPEAPIMKIAHYAVVADAYALLPKLTASLNEALKEVKRDVLTV